MPNENTISPGAVNRNEVISDLVKFDIAKGKTKGNFYYAPSFELGDLETIKFLGQADVDKLINQAVKNLGREIHKEVIGSDPEIVAGSEEYLERYQALLDGWEADVETKSDLQMEEEQLTQLGQQIAMQALSTGATRIVHEYKSNFEKDKIIRIVHDIPQIDGLDAKDSALANLREIVTQATDIRSKIQAKTRTRGPNKPKTPAIATNVAVEVA